MARHQSQKPRSPIRRDGVDDSRENCRSIVRGAATGSAELFIREFVGKRVYAHIRQIDCQNSLFQATPEICLEKFQSP
jgi:hypothetical protein